MLAADRRTVCQGMRRTATKIYAVNDHLIGFSGRNLCEPFMDWFRAGAHADRWPPHMGDTEDERVCGHWSWLPMAA
jgi:hypothetical protein